MSHHSEGFFNAPTILHIAPEERVHLNHKIDLIVKGQGTLLFHLGLGAKKFSIEMKSGKNRMRFTLNSKGARFFINDKRIKAASEENNSSKAQLDPDPHAPYWVSFDVGNGWFKYGIGEVRNALTQEQFHFESKKWMYKISRFKFSCDVLVSELYRDPVTTDPPAKVKHPDDITIDDVAHNLYTVPANLTPTCQKLYQNVAGRNFQLNTPDFPDFATAIEHSIRTEGAWCHTRLQEKSEEFGKPNILATYLRITLGQNQGESPGIPYVVEIWPPQHFSPIHNHANANAVIRVLHGQIHVDLFPMLSEHHREPFASVDFLNGEVAWISPRYNQTHRLINNNPASVTCITIQCYLYGGGDSQHYRYFDYLEDGGDKDIHQYDPDSDMDFIEFKEVIRKEWNAFLASGTGEKGA